MKKMQVKDVHYYVFDRAYPKIGMSEVTWNSRSVPVPALPPEIGKPPKN